MNSIMLNEDAGINRDGMITELAKRNIDSRPVFPAISQYPLWNEHVPANPVGKQIGDNAINLPSGVCLSKAEVDYICDVIGDIIEGN